MQNFYALVAFAEGQAAGTPGAEGGIGALIGSFMPLILMIVIFYFLLIRPQQKREKQFRAMLASLQTGDTVITNSGIEGRIVTVKDEEVVIETGADRIKLTFKKWAIKEVVKMEA